MVLEEITKIDSMESLSLEMKVRLDRQNTLGWLKTVAGFCNAEGGVMYVGVEDKSNKLVGFDRAEADNERNFFNNEVNQHIFPRPETRVNFISYENNGRELFVLKITIEEAPVKPITVKYKEALGIYMRRDGYTNGATIEEIVAMSVKSSSIQYDMQPSDIPYKRSDFSKLFEFHREHTEGKELTDAKLDSIDFYDEKKKLKKGAILFMDSYDGDKTLVKCSLFSGFTRGSDRIITIKEFRGNITDSIAFMMEFVTQRMNHMIIKKAQGRDNIDAYPERALFEGIVNAVAYRDYFMDGTQIQVDMFRDRLEISSPGSYFSGAKIEKTYDLSNFSSKRRNKLISAVLVACSVMEAAGTGFGKIIEAYSGADDAHRPFIYSSSDHFRLTLPDLTYDEGILSDELPLVEFVALERCSDHDEKILRFCAHMAHKSSEIALMLGINDSTYFRKNILDALCNKGYLEVVSSRNPKLYRTAPEIIVN